MTLKLYDSIGPNPWLVRIFLAEKQLAAKLVEVDLLGGENRRADFLRLNPAGQTPALELASGAILTETLPICEYLEELQPAPALIGTTAEQRANTRIWTRRVELHVTGPMADGFRFGEGLALFQNRIHVIPQASADLKAIAQKGLRWFDRELQTRPYLAGAEFSLADVLLYPFVEFFRDRGQPLDPALRALAEWHERVGKRPSVPSTRRA